MRNDEQGECGDSISIMHPDEEAVELREESLQKINVLTKIQSVNHFSCIHIHKNTLYLGTRNARLFIYSITQPQANEDQTQNNDFVLKQQKVITPHCQTISLINSNDEYFITVPQAEEDSFISIWSTTSRYLLTALKGHGSQISQIVFMKYKNYFVTSSWDCTIKIWSLQELQNQEPVKSFKGNYPILNVKEFNEEILVFGGDDCYLVFWNWKKNEIVKKEFGHAGSVTFIEVMESRVFTAGGDNKFRFWEVSKQQNPESNREVGEVNFKSKYLVKKLEEQIEQYDSIVFGTFYENYFLVIDKQGELFLFVNHEIVYHLTNFFDYNQNITGIDVFGDFVLITTTKGALKHFSIRSQINRLTKSMIEEQNVASENKILKIASSSSERNSNQRQIQHLNQPKK